MTNAMPLWLTRQRDGAGSLYQLWAGEPTVRFTDIGPVWAESGLRQDTGLLGRQVAIELARIAPAAWSKTDGPMLQPGDKMQVNLSVVVVAEHA